MNAVAKEVIAPPRSVPDLTCVVTLKRRWRHPWNTGEATVICGRAAVEDYLREGYVFDWEATDAARARDAKTDGTA